MDFRETMRRITGPEILPAVPRLRRFLTSADVPADEADASPGLIQKPDGTVWIVNPDGSEAAVGGSQTVACYIQASEGVQINDSGTPHYLVWDTVLDTDPIEAFPDGIGLDSETIGADTIATTEAGVWSFSAGGLSLPADPTWTGVVYFGNFGEFQSTSGAYFLGPPVSTTDAGSSDRPYCFSLISPMLQGDGFSMGFDQRRASTSGDPLLCSAAVTVAVVRLG